MIQEGKTASSCSVPATISAKKQIIQTSRAIIITYMIGMGFCTSLFFPGGIETEMLPASIAELKGVLIQNRVADFTVANLHRFALEDKGKRSEAKPFHLLAGWAPPPSNPVPHSDPTGQTS